MTTEPTSPAPDLPLFGRVPKNAVMARYGRLIADTRCECAACTAAGVEGPPVLAPAGVDDVQGHMVSMGLWLHGPRLRELEVAKAQFKAAFSAVIDRLEGRPS